MSAKLKTYSIIRREKVWHLTQRQARPPEKSELGTNTVCGVWALMKDGYERGMPTCETCLRAVVEYESKQPVQFQPEAEKPQPWKDWTHEDIETEVAPWPILREERHFSAGSRRRRRGG